ncbi:MAG TPA: hypothetical protein VGR98_04430 [Streptosporangiaceae bacterium]|nr:hypothetical protein [Streptosporangiaceae bacterium]
MTAAQCERFVAAHRKVSGAEELASRAARRVSVHVAEDGTVTVTARLPAIDGAVVLQALRAAAGDCEHPHRPHDDPAEDTAHAGPAGQAGQGMRRPAGRAWPMPWLRWPGRICRGRSPLRATPISIR